jgi:hypothetical protein
VIDHVIDRLVRFVNAVSFHRGLALGALVGAAIAGSSIWSRLRGSPRHSAPDEGIGPSD